MIERKEGREEVREYDGRGNGTERDLCNDEFKGGWMWKRDIYIFSLYKDKLLNCA